MAAVKHAVQAMVTEKRAITAEEAKATMQDLFAGTATQAQTGAFLTSLQVRLRVACVARRLASKVCPCIRSRAENPSEVFIGNGVVYLRGALDKPSLWSVYA